MFTLAESITLTGKPVGDHLDPADLVPRIDRIAAQGDVLILRLPATRDDARVWDDWGAAATDTNERAELVRFRDGWTGSVATDAMPASVVLVESEASGNTHTLHPNGVCYYSPADDDPERLVLGILTVPQGSTALLSHQEHGNLEILPGTYQCRRQREYAGQWRVVAD
jgi:hypothetical protein